MLTPTNLKKTSYGLLTGLTLSLAISSSAFALDSKALLQNLQNKAQSIGLHLSYDDQPILDGDNITLKNVSINSAQNPNTEPSPEAVSLGTIRLEDIDTEDDGSFLVNKITAAQYNKQNLTNNDTPKEQLLVHDIVINKLYLSKKGKTYSYKEHLPFQKARIGSISYNIAGKPALEVRDISSKYYSKDDHFINEGQVGSFSYNPANATTEQAKELNDQLSALGYQNITGHITAASAWNPDQGDYEITDYSITADNVGTLNISFKLEGLTQYFINNYKNLKLKLINGEKANKEQPQLYQDILALVAQLQLDSLRIKYQDDSLTNRILNYLSQSSQTTKDQIIKVLKANVAIATQKLQDKQFSQRLNNQIGVFLDNPKSFEVTANPQQTAAFSSIMVVMGLSPEQLVNLLGIDVIANN